MNKKAAIPAIYIILGIVIIALAVPKILNLQKSQTTLYSIAGERWGCDVRPRNVGVFNEGSTDDWYHTVAAGTNFQISASSVCPAGKGLFDAFIGWTPFKEYRGSINFNCPSGGNACQVQLYCCPNYDCNSDSDCDQGEICETTSETDAQIAFDWIPSGGTWRYCKLSTDVDHRCWGIVNNACAEKLPAYKQSYLDANFGGKCPTTNPYKYENLAECQTKLCELGTLSCTASNGCSGIQTCTNGVWGTCTTELTKCLDGSCKTDCGAVGSKQISLTKTEWEEAVVLQDWDLILDSMCKLDTHCSAKTNYTIECIKSTEIWDANYNGAKEECQRFVTKISLYLSLGLLPEKFASVGCTIVGWLTEWKEDIPRGTCRATLSSGNGNGGFCIQAFDDWLSPYTKIDDCQTNTIIFLLVIGGGLIIFSRMLG